MGSQGISVCIQSLKLTGLVIIGLYLAMQGMLVLEEVKSLYVLR